MHVSRSGTLEDYGDELDSGSGSGDYHSGDDGPPDDDEDSDDTEGTYTYLS